MTPCSLHSLRSDSAVSAVAAADGHEHDLVMPGFRFHPTEEELIDFYLRRKVEGRCFNVDLITFLDLYRFDPWELPALAAIGEKEWFFYVPRDRKYRNGDRPNRVTASGYWKATGADRVIRSENGRRSIGLKKTLVFYSGKAPRGVRSSWIMNEYRLPHSDTDRFRKVEISLCRVYKRPGLEDYPRATVINSKQSSAIREHSSSEPAEISMRKLRATATATATATGTAAMDPSPKLSPLLVVYGSGSAASVTSLSSTTTSAEEDNGSTSFPMITSNSSTTTAAALTLIATSSPSDSSHMMDELNRLVRSDHNSNSNTYMSSSSSSSNNNFLRLQPDNFQSQHQASLNALPISVPTVSDINSKLWEWNYNTLQELYTDEMK